MSALTALAECFFTGLVTSLFILLFTQIGWLPLVVFTEVAQPEKEPE